MSSVAIIRYILANDATLTATVPATKIMAGVLPLNTVLPAIGITQISGVQTNYVSAPGNMQRDRVQVTVEATTYPQGKAIIDLIRDVFATYKRGTVNGFACDSVVPDLVGPDLWDSQTGIYTQSIDFIVRWNS
jgi:hypothetical protein